MHFYLVFDKLDLIINWVNELKCVPKIPIFIFIYKLVEVFLCFFGLFFIIIVIGDMILL